MASRGAKQTFTYVGIILMSIWAVFPLFWMIIISLKERIYTYDPSVWIFQPVFENYVSVFAEKNLGKFLINSAIVSLSTTFLALFFGTLAAYGFSRFKVKRMRGLMFFLLAVRMIPSVAIVIPIFVIARFGSMLDTRLLLIITYMIFNIPFTVWMMKGFFDEIPKELEEAAKVDGCTTLQTLYKIVLPVVQPGLIATSIFCIISSWNEFVYALFLTSIKSVTTPTIVQMFLSIQGVAWGEMSAVGTVSIMPVLLFAMIVQKNMVRGLSFGAVKG
ncbi:MAG: carbohydrate ABC transporter permease [Clostridiales bacterium]|nr:carbohydrate ABC transporter permease [Clostridiales bacterium]